MSTKRPQRPAAGRSRPATGARRGAVEQHSATPLVYLRQLPAWAVPLLLAGLLVAGLALRGWAGAVALCLLASFIGWLGYLSWPALTTTGRIGRAAAVACMLALAVFQATR